MLGGGGVTGIAWEVGLLAGLREGGADVSGADLVIGTSAGSAVGAVVASGVVVEAGAAADATAVLGGSRRSGTTTAGTTGQRVQGPRRGTLSRWPTRRKLRFIRFAFITATTEVL